MDLPVANLSALPNGSIVANVDPDYWTHGHIGPHGPFACAGRLVSKG